MNTAKAVAGLSRLVKRLVKDGVCDRVTYRDWKNVPANDAYMARCLGYTQGEKMPKASALVQPFFHPELPLIGLNYTNIAHISLHNFKDGWCDGIRLCRGIIFDQEGTLVAFPFPKFFNHGEHPETKNLRSKKFVATVKQDGHLGIIFEYKNQIVVTTRGCFVSKTSKIATTMLNKFRRRWMRVFPVNVTLLVEIIHPETEVHLKYKGEQSFIVIGAFDRVSFHDFDFTELEGLSKELGLKLTPRWEGNSLAELAKLMKDQSVLDAEGFVARIDDGQGNVKRVKFKFLTYIGKMIGAKLAPVYVMRRMMDGSLDKRIKDLPFEVQSTAAKIKAKVMGVKKINSSKKDRWQYLYAIESAENQTDSYKTACRSFQTWLVKSRKAKLVA